MELIGGHELEASKKIEQLTLYQIELLEKLDEIEKSLNHQDEVSRTIEKVI